MNATPSVAHVALSRTLDLFTVTLIGVGAMSGASIFVLTGIAPGLAGPALLLAHLLNGMITMLTAMAYAELGSCFPEAGSARTARAQASIWRRSRGESVAIAGSVNFSEECHESDTTGTNRSRNRPGSTGAMAYPARDLSPPVQ